MKGVFGLGACFDELYKQHVRPSIIEPTFVMDYPAEMIALAKRKADDPTKIASFQLLACGTEFLKAYNELNDPKDQADRWLEEQKLADQGSEIASQFDSDYIRALEYGMPPTAGWGMGIDRFTQLITDSATIKDVILFPSMRSESQNTMSSVENTTGSVVIGQILSINQHPNADNLLVCQVEVGQDKPLQIITSVHNIKINDLVGVALVGSIVPKLDGQIQKIKKTKMRGEITEAMLCSPFELGVSDNHSIIHILDSFLIKNLGEDIKSFI